MLAPIVVFAYNRPDHLKKTIDALRLNPEARASELFVFSDGPRIKKAIEKQGQSKEEYMRQAELITKKNQEAENKVNEVRAYLDALRTRGWFAKVSVIKAQKNKGLANSVITGVDQIIHQYGKVIVVEDDAVCSPQFLEFMNKALDYYECFHNKVWFIGGYCMQMQFPPDYKYDFFLSGRGSSFAWATWLDRWNKIDWSVNSYPQFCKNLRLRRKFNHFGQDRSHMLDDQMRGKIDSWAIRFSYEMFRHNMYAILPTQSLIKTIGRDGSGTHATTVSHDFDVCIDHARLSTEFCDVELDDRIIKQQRSRYKMPKTYLLKEYLLNVVRRN